MWPLFRNVRLKYECSFHRIPRSQLRVAVIRRVLGRSIGRPPLLDNSSRTSLPISGSRNGTRSEMVVACGKARQHRCLLRHWCQVPRVGAFIGSVGVQTRAGRAPSSFNVDVANVSWNTRRVGPPPGFPYARFPSMQRLGIGQDRFAKNAASRASNDDRILFDAGRTIAAASACSRNLTDVGCFRRPSTYLETIDDCP